MRIDPNDKVAGIPVMKVREFLRQAGDMWRQDRVRGLLKIGPAKARALIAALLDRGYIREETGTRKAGMYSLTLEGNAFCLATAARPIKRSTADRIVGQLLERARSINRHDCYLYNVSKIIVFGSYLSGASDLGDIDVAIELVPKERDPERHHALKQARIQEALDSGRHFNTVFEQISWPQSEVYRFLKSRSRALSLHPSTDEILTRTTRQKVVYSIEDDGD